MTSRRSTAELFIRLYLPREVDKDLNRRSLIVPNNSDVP